MKNVNSNVTGSRCTTSSVTLQQGVAVNGDSITIEIYKLADYRIDTQAWDGSSVSQLSLIIFI